MKSKRFKYVFFLLIFLLGFFVTEINKVDAAKPTVTIPSSPTNITTTSAKVYANISGVSIQNNGFCYIASSAYQPEFNGYATCSYTTAQTGGGSTSLTITGLDANTTYYYKGFAINSDGTGYSDRDSFTTSAKSNQATLTVNDASGTYGSSITLSTSGGSGTGAITYALDTYGATATGCSVTTAGVLTATSSGTCNVNATKAADANYNATTSANKFITFNKANQATLTVNDASDTYDTTNGYRVQLSTSGGSGTGAITYALDTYGATATGCSVTTAGVLTATSSGTCNVNATKAADANYKATTSVNKFITFNKANQATLTASATTASWDSSITISTTGGSTNGTKTYTIVYGTGTGSCSINSSGILTKAGAGTCDLYVTMAGNTNYNEVTSATITATFTPAPQTAPIIFSGQTITFGQSFTNLSASGGSGTGSFTYGFSYDDPAGAQCSINGNQLSYENVGYCVVLPTKAGDANYEQLSSSPANFYINPANQLALTASATTGPWSGSITVSASGGSTNGTKNYYVSPGGTATGCSINSSTGVLTATSAGTCKVYATMAGNTNYNEVTSATIDAIFTIPVYTISFSSTGSSDTNYISPGRYDEPEENIGYGSTVPISVLVDTGYHASISGCGSGPATIYDTYSGGPDAEYNVTITEACTVYVTFSINTYTITASSGSNGTVTPTGITTKNYNTSQAYTIAPSDNYHIVDVLVDSVSQGAISSYTFSNISANHTISATFAINTYLVSTSTSGGANGTVSPASKTVDYGSTTTFTITPNTGYSASASGCGGSLSGTTYTTGAITSACTVSVTWSSISYTYTFDGNGATTNPNPTSVTQNYATPISTPTSPLRTGHTFNGWSPVIPATMPVGGGTSTAQWNVNQYTITFNSAGGSAVTAITQNYGTPITAPSNPTRSGYSFAGWSPSIPPTMPATNQTITAIWNATSYTFTAVPSLGTLTCNGEACASTYPYGTSLSMSATSVAGYTVSLSSTGTANGCVSSGGGAGAAATCTATMPAGNTGVTATYTAINYDLSITSNGGTMGGTSAGSKEYGSPISITQTPPTGYSFNGWTSTDSVCTGTSACTFNMPAKNVNVTANYTKNSYDLSITSNGGTMGGTSAGSKEYGSPISITQIPPTGYSFNGWTSTDSFCTGTGDCTFNMPAKAVTVTANYTINTYTITASSGSNGTVTPTGITTKNYNTSQAYTIAPSANYHIVDVLVDSVSQGAISSYTFSNISANHTISATFAINTYLVSTSTSGGANGTVSPASKTVDYGSTTTFTITPNTGYSASASGCGGSLSGTTYTTGAITSACTVSVTWSSISYTYTFDGNGATTNPNPTSVTQNYGTAISTPTSPLRTGYTFNGWSPVIPATMPVGGGTSTAQWNVNTQSALTITSTSVTYPSLLTLTTEGGSGTGEVTYVVNSGSCTILGSTLTPTGAGSCSVTATKAPSTNYPLPVSSTATTINIALGNQSALTFNGQTITFGGLFATLTATGGTGSGDITFAVTNAGTASCSITSGTTLNYVTDGTCEVTATKDGGTNYNDVSKTALFTVNLKETQEPLIVTSISVTYPSPLTLTTEGGSSTGAVTYSVTNGTATGCTITGDVLSYTTAGNCIVTAKKAEDTTYAEIFSSPTTVTINPKQLTISNPTLTTSKPYDGNTSASVTAGTLTGFVGSENVTVSAVATYADANVGTGKTITVVYTLAGTDAANYIKPVNYTVSTGEITQKQLTISNPTLTTSKPYDGNTNALVTAGTLTGFVGSENVTVSAVATYADANVGTGKTITVVYTLAGTDAANYIKPVNYTVSTGEITAINQSALTFNGQTITFGNYFATLSATGGTGSGDITFAVTTPGTAGCTITEGTILNYTSVGTCEVTATKAGGINYNNITKTSTFNVGDGFVSQSNYRFFENKNSLSVSNPISEENSPAVLSTSNEPFRLKMLLNTPGSALIKNGFNFKLQYAVKSGACDVGFEGENYEDISIYTPISFYNNSGVEDRDQIISSAYDPNISSSTIYNQSYVESNNFSNSISDIGLNSYGKWDFSLYDKDINSNVTYCIRVIKSNGSLLDGYSYIPEITTANYKSREGGYESLDDDNGTGVSGESQDDGVYQGGGDPIEEPSGGSNQENPGGNQGGGDDLGFYFSNKRDIIYA